MSSVSADMTAIEKLRPQIKGRMIRPQDPEYDDARKVFVGGIDRRPAVIVRVADTADVARVVEVVREAGLELAIRSGGHSGSGYSVSDGGVVIDLRDMKALTINAEDGTAWAETGLTAREYTGAAQAHGLATAFGDTGSVGIGGLTLGGGLGYLSRLHGLTIDNLIAADIVTADGSILRADAESNADLYWAIRGGGGNFGVATRFNFRLHPVGTVYGGMLMLPATADNIASFVAAADAAPENVTTIANVMTAPPMPFVPAEYHGKLVLFTQMVSAGAIDAGERALAPFRAIATPILDTLRPMPYPEMFPPDDPTYHPIVVNRATFVDSIDRQTAQTILDYLGATDAKLRLAQIRVLGGAVSRVPADATAYAHRARRILVNVAAMYDRPENATPYQDWATRFWHALPNGQPGAYVNFLGDDGPSRIHEAYPGKTLERLAAIKARYDPTNLFRLNENVLPEPIGVVRT